MEELDTVKIKSGWEAFVVLLPGEYFWNVDLVVLEWRGLVVITGREGGYGDCSGLDSSEGDVLLSLPAM